MPQEQGKSNPFPHAGADVLIMYHPEAATALRRTIVSLMD